MALPLVDVHVELPGEIAQKSVPYGLGWAECGCQICVGRRLGLVDEGVDRRT
jgi:hypothetical protein